MTRNPFVNAVMASGYIVGLVFFITNVVARPDIVEPTMLIPILMLSLFVFSAALMAYLFLYQPFVLYIEGQKQEAVNLFLGTLGVFGVITTLFLVALLLL